MKGNGNNGQRRLAGLAIRCQPDSRLVGLVREGQDRAFEEIVRRYRAPLVTFAGGIVPDHCAEDVVQEALTKAHSALGRSDAEMNLKPWLYMIVRNGALNSLRNEPAHSHLDENFDGVPQPPEVAARREELAALTARIKRLPNPQREAIVKRELEGRSHEEIASSLGVSAGAVRGLIYRARATLRDGAGLLIPMPVLRALLSSGTANPETTGAAGAAAGLAAGGGGIAVKAGATLGVAVIAVGSGFAVQHRSSKTSDRPAAVQGRDTQASRAHRGGGSSAAGASRAVPGREGESGHGGPGAEDSSGRGGHEGSSGSSSGPGSGSGSGSGSSGEGSGTDDGGHSGGSGSGSDDGGGGSSGPGGGLDDGGSSGSGDDDGSGTSGSGDDGGSSGSGSSDDGGDDTTTTTTSTTTTDDVGDGGGTSGGSG
jgi:RNA polymerase sigma factor (sigma-70 family)